MTPRDSTFSILVSLKVVIQSDISVREIIYISELESSLKNTKDK